MFDDAWRCMKYRFYDPKLHGTDWDAMRAKYKPLVAYVADRHELMNVINEMIGELNASHTGASGRPRPRAGRRSRRGPVTTRHLGLDLQADAASRPLPGYPRLRGRAGRQGLDQDREGELPDRHRRQAASKPATTTTSSWAAGSTARSSSRSTASPLPREPGRSSTSRSRRWRSRNLRYERWVKERRELVDKLSGGRVGYLHIKAMDQASLAKFKKELGEFRHKEGLVIDERWNSGGNIEQELLAHPGPAPV